MGSFGYSGNDTEESGQIFLSALPATGDVPVYNAATKKWDPTTVATLNAAYVPKSAFTAKGDILVGTGAGTYSALPLGTATEQLTVGGAGATGVEWATA